MTSAVRNEREIKNKISRINEKEMYLKLNLLIEQLQ